MPPDSAETHVYHVGGPLRRNMAWVIFGPFCGLLLAAGLASGPPDRAAVYLITAFLALVGVGVHWLVGRPRLEISSWGVRLKQPGYLLETPWSNLERLRMGRGHEGFVTREPMNSKGARVLSSMRGVSFGLSRSAIYDNVARLLLYEQRYIPIEAFVWHVRKGKMAGDLQRLAPQLPLLNEPVAPKAKPTPEQRRKDILGLLYIFGFTAAVLITAIAVPTHSLDRFEPAAWGLFTAVFAFQAFRSAPIAWRTGRKWMALLYALFAILMSLWSLERWHATFAGQPPKKAHMKPEKVTKPPGAKPPAQ